MLVLGIRTWPMDIGGVRSAYTLGQGRPLGHISAPGPGKREDFKDRLIYRKK